jgi:uncharacterized protein (TIGR01244 family)
MMPSACLALTTRRTLLGLALLATPILAAATGAPATPAAPAPAADPAPFVERALAFDGIRLAGQPAAADFATIKAAGVTRVISLRTPAERATLGFDDAAAARDAGLAYADLPIDGSGGFTPEVLDAFSKAMAEGGGDLLLHCGSGARAGQLYAAWLVRERGLSPQEAMQRVAPLGLWPLPMERMLNRPLELRLATPGSPEPPPPPPPAAPAR